MKKNDLTEQSSQSHWLQKIFIWFDSNIFSLGREMRLSYLPPLMVYVAAGVSGLTGIVGTFYVKEKLGLSPEFLAMLGFWMMLPWALKMPLGHYLALEKHLSLSGCKLNHVEFVDHGRFAGIHRSHGS